MKIIHIDRAEKVIADFDSRAARATRLAHGARASQLTCLRIDAGGTIGAHPASMPQLFVVVAGMGWVAGNDGIRHPVAPGKAALWDRGEVHVSGSDTGMLAVALEAESLELFAARS